MQELSSRVAYLQGLCKGMDIDTNTNEGKLLDSIVNVLQEFASALDEMEREHLQIEDYLESIDEDLLSLEDSVYTETAGELAPGDYLEVNCPGCGETVCFDAGLLEDEDAVEVTCPNCEGVVFTNEESTITGGSEELEPATLSETTS